MLVCLSVHLPHYWYITTTLDLSLGSVMNAISSNRTEQLQLNTVRMVVKAEAGVQELLSQTLCMTLAHHLTPLCISSLRLKGGITLSSLPA